jgi:hypothetical protein
MGKFPSYDFHLIIGKIYGRHRGHWRLPHPPTPQLLQNAVHLEEIFLNYMKFIYNWETMGNTTCGAIV